MRLKCTHPETEAAVASSSYAAYDIHVALPPGLHPSVMHGVALAAAGRPVRIRASETSLSVGTGGDAEAFCRHLYALRRSGRAHAMFARCVLASPLLSGKRRAALLDQWSDHNLRVEHVEVLLRALIPRTGADLSQTLLVSLSGRVWRWIQG